MTVSIEFNIFENCDWMAGVGTPELSLAVMKTVVGYKLINAVEVIKTPKLNCFSYMDDSVDFDKL